MGRSPKNRTLWWKNMHMFKIEVDDFCLGQDKTGFWVKEPPKTVVKERGEPAGRGRVPGGAC